MNYKKTFLIVLSAIFLSACQTTEVTAIDSQNNQCGAPKFQTLIGQPASVLDTLHFSMPMRHITPNTAVTMDFNPQRLNIESNESGVISRIYCA